MSRLWRWLQLNFFTLLSKIYVTKGSCFTPWHYTVQIWYQQTQAHNNVISPSIGDQGVKRSIFFDTCTSGLWRQVPVRTGYLSAPCRRMLNYQAIYGDTTPSCYRTPHDIFFFFSTHRILHYFTLALIISTNNHTWTVSHHTLLHMIECPQQATNHRRLNIYILKHSSAAPCRKSTTHRSMIQETMTKRQIEQKSNACPR